MTHGPQVQIIYDWDRALICSSTPSDDHGLVNRSVYFPYHMDHIIWTFRFVHGVNNGRFNDLGIHWPPTPADQGPCGFDKGRPRVSYKCQKFGQSISEGTRSMKSWEWKLCFYYFISPHKESPDFGILCNILVRFTELIRAVILITY